MTSTCSTGYGSPRWSGEIADCSLPMTLDTYSNCAFGCVYCFSQYQRGIGGGKDKYFHKEVKSINVDKVIKLFALEDKKSQFYEWVKNRRTIQYGGLSDQFDGYERKYGKTLELLTYLRKIEYPISFSTKSDWVFFDDRYRALFKDADNWNMKFSIITLDEEKARKIEVGVPSPQRRLAAMAEYAKLNKGGATLRLRPFIPGISDVTYLDLIKEAHAHGATAVSTEFFCLEMRSVNIAKEHYRAISEAAGFDIVDMYRAQSTGSGYLRLNRKVKGKYFLKMKELCDKLGMRFYVSDAHFKELCNNSCCCGLPTTYDYSKGNFSYALEVAKKTGGVTWNEVEKDMKHLEFSFVGAQGFNTTSSERKAKFYGKTMKEYMRWLWNNPKAGQSPFRIFEGILVPCGFDAEGNIIYRYDGAKSHG